MNMMFGRAHGFGDVGRETEPPGGQVLGDERLEPGLEDRQLSPAESRDLLGDDVGAQHVVSGLGQAGTHDQSDVSGADDRDVHR